MKLGKNEMKHWKVAQFIDLNETFPGKNRMIKGMKQLLPILYPYIDNNYRNHHLFKNDTPLEMAFDTFLKAIDEIDISYTIGYDDNYYINVHNDFIDDMTVYWMSVDFLPGLWRQNRKLYNIMFEAIKMNVIGKGVELNDSKYEDYFWESILSNYEECKYEDEKIFYKEIIFHHNKYCDKICNKLQDGSYSDSKLERLISRFKPDSIEEKILLEIANGLLKAFRSGGIMDELQNYALQSFCDYNDYDIDSEDLFEDGYPVMLNDLVKFNWFSHEDYIEDDKSIVSETAGNFGNLTYSTSEKCYSHEDVKKYFASEKVRNGDFLTNISKAFSLYNSNKELIYEYCNRKLSSSKGYKSLSERL